MKPEPQEPQLYALAEPEGNDSGSTTVKLSKNKRWDDTFWETMLLPTLKKQDFWEKKI